MVKRILGFLAAAFTVVVIVFAILGRNDFRSLVEPNGRPAAPGTEQVLPADRPDSTVGSAVEPLQVE